MPKTIIQKNAQLKRAFDRLLKRLKPTLDEADKFCESLQSTLEDVLDGNTFFCVSIELEDSDYDDILFITDGLINWTVKNSRKQIFEINLHMNWMFCKIYCAGTLTQLLKKVNGINASTPPSL